MLASVYSYRVTVKSVSSCCVRGRRVLSNPVTYYDVAIYIVLDIYNEIFMLFIVAVTYK